MTSSWRIVALGTEALQKTSFIFSAGHHTITWGQKDSRVSFRECPALHSQKGIAPNLNPFDFEIWLHLESKVSATHHQNFETLMVKLQKQWAKFPQKVISVTRKAFPKRLQPVIGADGGYIV